MKLDAKKAQKKVSRWQQISESAAKQSKRMLIPEVKNVMNWKEALAFAKGLDVVLIPYELAQGMKETREILAAIQPGQSVGIFIGPEGGFEEEEVRDAMEAGGKPVTLGRALGNVFDNRLNAEPVIALGLHLCGNFTVIFYNYFFHLFSPKMIAFKNNNFIMTFRLKCKVGTILL